MRIADIQLIINLNVAVASMIIKKYQDFFVEPRIFIMLCITWVPWQTALPMSRSGQYVHGIQRPLHSCDHSWKPSWWQNIENLKSNQLTSFSRSDIHVRCELGWLRIRYVLCNLVVKALVLKAWDYGSIPHKSGTIQTTTKAITRPARLLTFVKQYALWTDALNVQAVMVVINITFGVAGQNSQKALKLWQRQEVFLF